MDTDNEAPDTTTTSRSSVTVMRTWESCMRVTVVTAMAVGTRFLRR